jgi:uncharacterized membrane protein YhhN
MILVAIVAIAVVATLIAERAQYGWRPVAKMVASSGFVAVAISAGGLDSSYGRLVVGALALAWCGDFLLGLSSQRAFLVGLAAFLVGHLVYVAAFGARGLVVSVVALSAGVVMLVGVAVWRWLHPHLDRRMLRPVAAYVVVVSAMVAAALGTHGWLTDWRIVAGAIAFFLSDLFVARERFVSSGFSNRMWGLPLYYSGQILLALSVGTI